MYVYSKNKLNCNNLFLNFQNIMNEEGLQEIYICQMDS